MGPLKILDCLELLMLSTVLKDHFYAQIKLSVLRQLKDPKKYQNFEILADIKNVMKV